VIGAAVLLVLWWRRPSFSIPAPIDYAQPSDQFAYLHVTFKALPRINRNPPNYEFQSVEWQDAMKRCGIRLSENRVRAVYFVHGTFVGNDPVGVVSMLGNAIPVLPKSLEKTMLRIAKRPTDALTKDLGNYIPSYVSLYQQALGVVELEVRNFTWSSGNHHLARLRGAIDLAQDLYRLREELALSSTERILLHGHSHAGLLFSLLCLMINNPNLGEPLRSILKRLFQRYQV